MTISNENAAASGRQPLFQLNDARVVREGRTIFHADSFALQEGEHMALLGPNGAGKSTFVKLLTHDVHPLHRDTPPVLFRGGSRVPLEDIRRCVGIVSSTMQDQVNVRIPAVDVVAGGLFGTLGVPRHVTVGPKEREAALRAMDMLGIADVADRIMPTLSTGQARRVLIARALVGNPEVLIFDEPCTGLDPAGMFQVRSSLRALAHAGKTIVLVTHYPEDIIPEIKRIVLIKDGGIYVDGPKEEVLTDRAMSQLFDVPLHVQHLSREGDEYYSLASAY